MPRLLFIITLDNIGIPTKTEIFKHERTERLWLSITGINSPTIPVTAALSRTINPPVVVARPPVATLASAVSSRPAFVNVKPQVAHKKRKRVDSPASPAYTDSDDDSSDEEPLINRQRQKTTPPVAPPEEDLPTPPSSSKRRRLSSSLTLSPSSLLLVPASSRGAEAKFSPGQVVWATFMLKGILDGSLAAARVGVSPAFLLDGIKMGAESLEEGFENVVGMDGFVREKALEEYGELLGEVLEEAEAEIVESEVEADVKEMEDVEESDVEEEYEEVSDGEVDEDGFVRAMQVPIVVQESSSSDEEFSSSEEE